MRKLFGTDGIRGKVNIYPLTGEVAFRLGQAAALKFREGKKKIKVIVGKDTRRSGYIFEYALTSGLCSMGADVYLVGPMPTPAIAHLVRSFAADAGIVISASHNPAGDNGIKFFDSQGYKLPDDIEEEIESLISADGPDASHVKIDEVGRAYRIDDAAGRYIEFAKGSVRNNSLFGLKVVLDCANGAAYKVAPLILSELGAEIVVYSAKPDGLNINDQCGALHPEILSSAVLGNQADAGIALDGDADRVIMADEAGRIIDGDRILAICGLYMKENRLLKSDTVVGTVASGMGFEAAMRKEGIRLVRTAVGDRYIIEEMRKNNYNLGGEQSGHIIHSDYNTSGDGTVSALQVLSIMIKTGKKLSELGDFEVYPQEMINITVSSKPPLASLKTVASAIRKAEEALGADGRVLVRYSGTENKCRVMVEGKDAALVKEHVAAISREIKKQIGE